MSKQSEEKRAYWRDVLRRQRESGMNIRSFCRKEKISEVAVGTALSGGPRADPYVRNYRIRLLPRVFGVKAYVWIRVQDFGFRYPSIGDFR